MTAGRVPSDIDDSTYLHKDLTRTVILQQMFHTFGPCPAEGDRRLPGHQLWSQVPRATGGPSWATVLAAVIGAVITLVLRTHTGALVTLFTASTIMPALLYAGTVLLYVLTSRRRGGQGEAGATPRPFGRWELPIVAGALIWLAYELIILIGPGVFRDAQYYVLGALAVGLVFYVVQLLTEREAIRKEPGQG